ncbi:putative aryl-alcohol dehydrogenase [Lophium mytilinum]|uniref:Putative aryl-alcohol dehydrogenase n=1 Tax=Lophium mytilinum TaxID=390894 RepID=A0A6A6RBR2_9PEZI|nr:putative aryl-alcohol dehydrogenase [Lophium mytilinum]
MNTSSTTSLDTETYDYIIVGGGTSGLVVANRLSEDASVRVLVLEAGADATKDPRIFIPGLAPSTYWNPDFDWAFTSTPQKQLGGRTIAHSMGKTLGGSSAINMGMIIWPGRVTFDSWKALGNPGWGWDESMVNYIKKFHTYNPPSAEVQKRVSYEADESAHGTSGPVQVNFGTDYMPYHEAWAPTFKAMGYPLTGDPVTGVSSGAFISGGAIDPVSKTRSHSAAVYFNDEIAKRPNLRVVTEAFVEKVLLKTEEDGSVTAKGVQVRTKDGVLREISTAKEVILAAGSFKSPQILELSGIGNPSLLQLHGIPVVIPNINVGENLQDHALIPFNWEVAEGASADIIAKDPSIMAAAMEAYQTAKAGPLGQNPLVSSFIPIDLSDAERNELVDTQVAAHPPETPAEAAQFEQLRHILDIPNEPTAQYTFAPMQLLSRLGPLPSQIFGMSHDGYFVTVVTALNHPFSRGSTHIASANPTDKPTIDIGYLRHPLDLELEARHLLLLEKIMAAEPMASLLKPRGRRIHNYDKTEPLADLEEAKKVARELVLSNWHTSGSCAMQPLEKGGVVSDKLLVYGTRNLRVVDASIFPLVPRGNIQASVFAVAEKCADVIKGEAGK